MQAVATTVRTISALNGLLGRIFSCFSLGIVIACFAVVAIRYGFRAGSVALHGIMLNDVLVA